MLTPDKRGEDVLTVGDAVNSVTRIPGILYDEKTGIIYCDCPDFGDTAGPEQEILNAFAIDLLFSETAPVSVVYVINYHNTTGGGRCDQIRKSSQSVLDLFRGSEQLKDCLSGVISQAPSRVERKKQSVLAKMSELNPLMHLLHTEAADRVFVFSAPTTDGSAEEGDIYNGFTDKAGLVKFIQSHAIRGLKHQVPLNDDCQKTLISIMQKVGNMVDFPYAFGEAIRAEVNAADREKNVALLREWLDRINSFANSSINNIDDFVSATEGKLPKGFCHSIEAVKQISLLGKFISSRVDNPMIAQACGQNIRERLAVVLENLKQDVKRMILFHEREIDEQKSEDMARKIKAESDLGREGDIKVQSEIEALVIKANDTWRERLSKYLLSTVVGVKNLAQGIKDVAIASEHLFGAWGRFFGSAGHTLIFGSTTADDEKN